MRSLPDEVGIGAETRSVKASGIITFRQAGRIEPDISGSYCDAPRGGSRADLARVSKP
jgi:hypothetical protein